MTKYFAPKTAVVSEREKQHMQTIQKLATECLVLLENDGTLPLKKYNGNIALFGSGARRTIKGGTGSGDVYSREVINIEQGFESAGFTVTTKEVLDEYDLLMEDVRRAY